MICTNCKNPIKKGKEAYNLGKILCQKYWRKIKPPKSYSINHW